MNEQTLTLPTDDEEGIDTPNTDTEEGSIPVVTEGQEEGEATGEPTKEEEVKIDAVVQHIQANYDFDVDVRPVAFHFKSQKDKDTGIKTKRDSVTLAIPYPSVKGIVTILETGGIELDLLREAADDIVTRHARALITDDETINAHTLDVTKLSWQFIANMPKPERTGGGIPKETWEAFIADYIDVMPEAVEKSVAQVTNAAKILLTKFSSVKTNFPVLEMLIGQLAVYADTSEDIETYKGCVEFLADKADKLLNISPEELLSSL